MLGFCDVIAIYASALDQLAPFVGNFSSAEANTQYFTLRGSVCDVQNMDNSLITSDESGALPPPRNWVGINDVYLVT